jgi:hypothetical protein
MDLPNEIMHTIDETTHHYVGCANIVPTCMVPKMHNDVMMHKFASCMSPDATQNLPPTTSPHLYKTNQLLRKLMTAA